MTGILPLAAIDVMPLRALLAEIEPAFAEDTWRQRMPMTPHRDSETIFLRQQPGSRPRDVLHSLDVEDGRYFDHPAIVGVCSAIMRAVGASSERMGRAMLIRLKPQGNITLHTDIGAYAEATERYHLPVITNPDAWLEVDGARYHMTEGVLYFFEKHRPHCGGNDGETGRIHLVVDVFRE